MRSFVHTRFADRIVLAPDRRSVVSRCLVLDPDGRCLGLDPDGRYLGLDLSGRYLGRNLVRRAGLGRGRSAPDARHRHHRSFGV
ncbi:hypothetical protein [Actinoplanes sp. G11-F43]|uniref:hypothetical protein n=1 Tax=Actinoplanes sp. G11-F43 TaxID=3424130 RepID=UPI003D33DDBB